MRATEFIIETTEQDQIIRILAGAATEKIINIFLGKESTFTNLNTFKDLGIISRKDRLTWLSGLPLSDLYLPQTDDAAINTMLKSVKIKMIDGYDRGNPNSMGAYIKYEGDGPRVIELYLPAIERSESDTGMTAADRVQSVLIHELTHALDDVKSAGKYSKTPWATGADDSPMVKNDERYQQYLRSKHEINARFLQALLDISINYHHVEGPHRLQDLIKSIFTKHKLDVANNQQMKRLMSRAYQYFNALQNNPKKAEPKSLARRALAWITSSPTSEIK